MREGGGGGGSLSYLWSEFMEDGKVFFGLTSL